MSTHPNTYTLICFTCMGHFFKECVTCQALKDVLKSSQFLPVKYKRDRLREVWKAQLYLLLSTVYIKFDNAQNSGVCTRCLNDFLETMFPNVMTTSVCGWGERGKENGRKLKWLMMMLTERFLLFLRLSRRFTIWSWWSSDKGKGP